MTEEKAKTRVPMWGWLLLAAGLGASAFAVANSRLVRRYVHIRET